MAVACIGVLLAPTLRADPYSASGAQYGRGYFAQLPFEHIDTVSGNLILSFTDLSLPGNAGFGLGVVRSYNSQDGRWRLGIAGVPLTFEYESGSSLDDVHFITADGGSVRAQGTDPQTYTEGFWRFTKSTLTLEMPNGIICTYGNSIAGVGGFLLEARDPFNNTLTFSWQTGTSQLLSVTQDLGISQSRTVSFANWTDHIADAMTYDGRTWTYAWQTVSATPVPVQIINSVTLPENQQWTFAYVTDAAGGKKLQQLTMPLGGQVSYTWAAETFPTTPSSRIVIKTRQTGGTAITGGTWEFDWTAGGSTLTVTGPSNIVVYTSTTSVIADKPMLASRSVKTPGGATLETESFTYELVPDFGLPVALIDTKTLERFETGGSRTYTTSYSYSPTNWADFGQPDAIVETGELTRTTTFTYRHDFAPYIRGRLTSATVWVGQQDPFGTTTTYDLGSGFVTATAAHGITTAYEPDASGNVEKITVGAREYLFSYSWGVVATSTTPTATVTRSVNSDASVASVTQSGVSTSFTYDNLGRITSVSPPLGAAVTTTYTGMTVSTTRGATVTTSQLDGFGRTLSTSINPGFSQDTLHQRMAYDAEGRVSYQSYPYTTNDIGDTFAYDALGRPSVVTHADSTTAQTVYVPGGVQHTNERGKTSEQAWAAFGHPGTGRLHGMLDENGIYWGYSYNAYGSLTKVTTAESQDRTWNYDGSNRLTSDVQPEAGTTTYPLYDAFGALKKKVDANGRSTLYTYDGNGRLIGVDVEGSTIDDVTIGYDSFDNTTFIQNASARTDFEYEGGTRLKKRIDAITRPGSPTQPYVFVTEFSYDTRENLTGVTYPSGRQVLYEYDHANRITKVQDVFNGVSRTLAQGIQYHPSGLMAAADYGNGTWESVSVWPLTGRPRHVQARRPLTPTTHEVFVNLEYWYDGIGNVDGLQDHKAGNSQIFIYDNLDRLTTVNGFSGAPWFGYTYDTLGNRLTKTSAAGTTTYGYNAAKRLTGATGSEAQTFGYDNVGNVTQEVDAGGTWGFTHTPANLLRGVTFGSQPTPPTIATYGYDGTNQRIEKITAEGRRLYIRTAGGQLLAEYLIRGFEPDLEREYVYLGARPLAVVTQAPASSLAVAITSHTNGQVIPGGGAGVTLSLQAQVSLPAGQSVARVEYYQQGIKIGQATSAPYTVTWNNLPNPPGAFTFRARVVTNSGMAAISTPVTVQIAALSAAAAPAIVPSPPWDQGWLRPSPLVAPTDRRGR